MNNDFLFHHGVKGQQWGVRHGPPYPVNGDSGTTIKKGTTFKRLSLSEENANKGHAYVNYLRSDSQRYRGFFAAKLKGQSRGGEVYSIDLVANTDLKSPSKKERLETFMEMYKDDPMIAKELGSYYKKDFHNATPLPTSFYQYRFSKLDGDTLRTKGYETFAKALGKSEYLRDEYFNKLSQKGYSFVRDDCDAGRFGKEPAIIFDRSTSTSYGGASVVSSSEILSTWRKEGTRLK